MVFKKGDKAWMKRKDRQHLIKETPSVEAVPFEPLPLEEQKDTMKRHTIGMMSAVETLYGPCFTSKCKTCYELYGWLTKCICK